MEFDEIRKTLEEEFGPDALVGDEPNRVDVRLDETMALRVIVEPTSCEVVLFAEIFELEEVGREDFYEQALKANWLFQGSAGAVVAIDPETKALALNRTHPMNTLGKEKFLAIMRSFVDTYGIWYRFACDWADEMIRRRDDGEAGDGAPRGEPQSVDDRLMDLRKDIIRG